MPKNTSNITIEGAKAINRTTKYRNYVSEADFYRPMSQLYDEVEERASKKPFRSVGWAFSSAGVSQLFTIAISDIPDRFGFTGAEIRFALILFWLSVLSIGLILLFISIFNPKSNSKKKESTIARYISREFADDAQQEIPTRIPASIADNGLDV